MEHWFAINHNGYLEHLGQHDLGDLDAEEYFDPEEYGDYYQFISEETARDYYEITKAVFEKLTDES